jgi:hypothetical protein
MNPIINNQQQIKNANQQSLPKPEILNNNENENDNTSINIINS